MQKVYVASSLHNADRVKQIIRRLESEQIIITYDWTQHGQVYSIDELTNIGILEEAGVIACDILLMVLPGRSGAHFEFGLARGLNKLVLLLEEEKVEQKTFYYLPGLIRVESLDEAITHIKGFKCLTN